TSPTRRSSDLPSSGSSRASASRTQSQIEGVRRRLARCDANSQDGAVGLNLELVNDLLDVLRRRLAPHYSVERELGAGGMATVFLAREEHPSRRVAIKVLDPLVATRLLRERFLREVDLSSKLTHPHIVPIFAAGEVDGLLYYVMPY